MTIPEPINPQAVGPTLADTVTDEYTNTGQQDYHQPEPQHEPVTTEVLVSSLAAITAHLVPEESRPVYVAEIVENPLLGTGLELVGTARALNQLAGTGRPMNPYLAVALGGLMCAVAVGVGVRKHGRKTNATGSNNHAAAGNVYGESSPTNTEAN